MNISTASLMKHVITENILEIGAPIRNPVILIINDGQLDVGNVLNLMQQSNFIFQHEITCVRDTNIAKGIPTYIDLVILEGNLQAITFYGDLLKKCTEETKSSLNTIMIVNEDTSLEDILKANQLGILHFNSLCSEDKCKEFVCKVQKLFLHSNVYENDIFSRLLHKLTSIAYTDCITGLHNRCYFDHALTIVTKQVDTSSAFLDSQSLFLFMIDLDNFKEINDTFGHLAGDCVLLDIAKKFNSFGAEEFTKRVYKENDSKRNSYFISRIGGDEFAFVICGTYSMENISNIASLLRGSIERAIFSVNDNKICTFSSLTISVGVTRYEKLEGVTKFVHRADNALFNAKEDGRNCVRIY